MKTAHVAPHRWRTGALRGLGSSGIIRCEECGADRRFSRLREAGPRVIEGQARMTAVLQNGYAVLDGQTVHPLPFFAGAAMIWSLLDDPRDAHEVWDELGLDVPGFVQCTQARYGSFERRSVDERAQLLKAFERLHCRGVDDFIRGLSLRRLSSRSLLRYSTTLRVPTPFWFRSIVRRHLDLTMYTPSDGELDEAIRYQLRIDGGRHARVSEVCRLLGMATKSNSRVRRRMSELGVPSSRT